MAAHQGVAGHLAPRRVARAQQQPLQPPLPPPQQTTKSTSRSKTNNDLNINQSITPHRAARAPDRRAARAPGGFAVARSLPKALRGLQSIPGAHKMFCSCILRGAGGGGRGGAPRGSRGALGPSPRGRRRAGSAPAAAVAAAATRSRFASPRFVAGVSQRRRTYRNRPGCARAFPPKRLGGSSFRFEVGILGQNSPSRILRAVSPSSFPAPEFSEQFFEAGEGTSNALGATASSTCSPGALRNRGGINGDGDGRKG